MRNKINMPGVPRREENTTMPPWFSWATSLKSSVSSSRSPWPSHAWYLAATAQCVNKEGWIFRWNHKKGSSMAFDGDWSASLRTKLIHFPHKSPFPVKLHCVWIFKHLIGGVKGREVLSTYLFYSLHHLRAPPSLPLGWRKELERDGWQQLL